jgi:GH24 family phage-related lysozyme (muramidase)
VKGKQYTLTECKVLLDADMQKAVQIVDNCHPGLPVPILASFADATLNLGATIACDRVNSTAARYLYQGDYIKACNQLPRWNKARVAGVQVELPGLTKRRAEERDLCLTGARG